MSTKVKARLALLGIAATHEERVALDLAIEGKTGKYCDEGVSALTDKEFADLLAMVREKLRRRRATGRTDEETERIVQEQQVYA